MFTVRVHKKGIIVIPKDIREKAKIFEGMLLKIYVKNGKIILEPLDLWDKVWGSCKGLGSAEEAELELDREEERFWERRK